MKKSRNKLPRTIETEIKRARRAKKRAEHFERRRYLDGAWPWGMSFDKRKRWLKRHLDTTFARAA